MPTVKKILPGGKKFPLKKVVAYCRVITKARQLLDCLVTQKTMVSSVLSLTEGISKIKVLSDELTARIPAHFIEHIF